MRDQLEALKLFVRVARTRSFSRAGKEVGVAQSSVSRIISALEKEVGAALLTRTTRAVVLTEAGAEYLERVEPLLLALEDATHDARGTGELRGELRVSMPLSLALREVIPNLSAFLDAHPALKLDLVMSDQRRDLLRDGVDVALRFGPLVDSSATSRLLGTNARLLAAAPAYLRRAGTPTGPADLARHRVIVGPAGDSAVGWSFRRGDESAEVRIDGRLVVNTNEGAIAAAVAGLGIVSTGSRGSRTEVASGALVRVLPAWTMGRVELHAVMPAGRAAKPSARAFVDFLLQQLEKDALIVDP